MFRFLWHARWILDVPIDRSERHLPVGYEAHMYTFGGLSAAIGFCVVLRLPMELMMLIFGIIGIVDVAVAYRLIVSTSRRLQKFGICGPIRARWWFELAALSWTLVCSTFLFALTHSAFNPRVAPKMAAGIGIAQVICQFLLIAFVTLAITGYSLGLIQGRRLRGRSIELVNFSFWMSVIVGVMFVIPQNRIITDVVGPVFAIIGIGAVLCAGLLELRKRSKQSTDDCE